MTVSRREGRSPSVVSSPSCSGRGCPAASLDATVASATTVAQIRTEIATCATTAHGRRRVHTLAAPTMIWTPNSTRAVVESRTNRGCLRVSVRALIAVHSTRSSAIAASTRWRNIAVAAPPSVGTSLPSINGQSVNTSCASLALTYVPDQQKESDDRRGHESQPREGSIGLHLWLLRR